MTRLKTHNGSYIALREYSNGETYLKIKIPCEAMNTEQLHKVADFVETIEAGHVEKKDKTLGYYFKKSIKKHLPRYFISNVIKSVFQAIAFGITLLCMREGILIFSK